MDSVSELDLRRQRAAKNQSLFREMNERIEHLASSGSFSNFICECMNETCDANVSVTLEEYENIPRGSNRFFVLPGHEVNEVEEIVDVAEGRYLVVSKLGAGRAIAEHLDPRKRDYASSPRST